MGPNKMPEANLCENYVLGKPFQFFRLQFITPVWVEGELGHQNKKVVYCCEELQTGMLRKTQQWREINVLHQPDVAISGKEAR